MGAAGDDMVDARTTFCSPVPKNSANKPVFKPNDQHALEGFNCPRRGILEIWLSDQLEKTRLAGSGSFAFKQVLNTAMR